MTNPSYQTVPVAFHDEKTHRRILAEASNRHNNAKFNCAVPLTLNANATTTTLMDSRITANSVLSFMPQTSDAAAAITGLYVTAQNGSATINHASTSATDKTFNVGIFG